MNECNLRKLQLREIEILNEFVNYCDSCHLKYILMGGTFLGAVRHKGFIPWDDDIDIGMPRPDYEKMVDSVQKSLPNHLVLKNFLIENEKTIYFSRIEDVSFPIIDTSALIHRKRYAWIDVFPLDGMPNCFFARQIHKFILLSKRLFFQYSNFSLIVNQRTTNRPIIEKILIKVATVFNVEHFFDTKKCLKSLDASLKKCDYAKAKYIVNFMGAYKFKEMFKKEIYENTSQYLFEGNYFDAPKNFDKVLSQLYGNYMVIPNENEKYKHGIESATIDTI